MLDINEILKKLPKTWDDVNLDMFHKLILCNFKIGGDHIDEIQNCMNICSALTEYKIEDLEDLPMVEVMKIVQRLDFMNEEVPLKQNDKFEWKDLKEISMDDYILFLNLKETQINNLDIFVETFNKKKMTKQEILNTPIGEILYGFFLFKRLLNRLLLNLIRREKMRIAKFKVKMTALKVLHKVLFKKTEEK